MMNTTSTQIDHLPFSAATIMALLSILGIFLNSSVFYGLVTQKSNVSGFFILCGSKTISNNMICLTFLIWAVPCTYFDSYFLPHQFNILFGQFGGWAPYLMGPFTQLCMSINRFCALFLPHMYSRSFPLPISLTGVLFFWTISIILTSLGLPPGCGFIYVISRLSWEPEAYDCAVNFAIGFFYLIVATSVSANVFNTTIALKLIAMAAGVTGMDESMSSRRRKRQTRLYIQSVTQDSLHVMDTINCSIISHLSDQIWYKFVFSSLSFLGIHVFDGLIMILFNQQLRPVCFRPSPSKIAHTNTSTHGTSTAVTN